MNRKEINKIETNVVKNEEFLLEYKKRREEWNFFFVESNRKQDLFRRGMAKEKRARCYWGNVPAKSRSK